MNNKAWVFLILSNLFWAGNLIFGKYTASEFPPIWTAFLRWIIALIFLIPLAQFIEKPSWFRVWKKNWIIIVLLSAIGVVIYNFLVYSSLQYTSAINGSLINSLTPAFIMIFSLVFLKEKISPIQVLGLIISFIGVLTVLTKGNLFQVFHTQYNKGDAIMLLSVIFWAVYSLLGKKAKEIPVITLVTMTAIIGILMMIPFIFFQPIHSEKVTSLGIIGIIYLGVFPSVGSFIFWNKGIKLLGAGIAGISLNLMPIFTAVIALILGHGLSMSQIAGGVIVIVGMLITTVKKNALQPKKRLSTT